MTKQSDRVYGDPQRSQESAFMMMAVVPKDATPKELKLDQSESITTVDFALDKDTLCKVEAHCDAHDVIIDGNLYMLLAGMEFRDIYHRVRSERCGRSPK